MKKKKISARGILNTLFGFLLAFVLTFFLCGELMLSRDNPTGSGTCTTWNTGWERVFADGSREAIELDSKCDAERGEVVRLEKRLPMAPESTWYCMRASQQDMRIYVEEELRKEYSTAETRWFGKDSASAFVFFEIEAADAGKMLAVELVSNISLTDRRPDRNQATALFGDLRGLGATILRRWVLNPKFSITLKERHPLLTAFINVS